VRRRLKEKQKSDRTGSKRLPKGAGKKSSSVFGRTGAPYGKAENYNLT